MPNSTVHRRTLLASLGAVAAWGAPAAWRPAGAAAAADGQWRDAARGRQMPWRLRLPGSPGPWPLVLYSHGLGGSRDGGDAWGEAWREAGIAVLHLQHPGSDIDTLRGGLRALREAASAEQLLERVRDVRFALDEVERGRRAGHAPWAGLREDAVGMAGHSFGAHTTQAIAGQRFAVPADLADVRPKAFIAFSPSAGRDRRDPREAFGGVARPFLAATGSLDGDPFGSHATGEPRVRVFDGLPAGRKALLWLDGADHMTFAGNAGRPIRGRGVLRREAVAAERELRHHALVARITSQWWRAHLLGDAAALAALGAPDGLSPDDRWVRA